MVMTDPIADLLTRIRNASRAQKETVDIPASNMKNEIVRILKEEGYVNDFEVIEDGVHKTLRVNLKYSQTRDRALMGIKRISKPGLRVYAKKDEVPRVLGGLGVAIISTSKGILTGKQAVRHGLGGEVVCFVW